MRFSISIAWKIAIKIMVSSQIAERSLLISNAITLHDYENNELIFKENILSKELFKLNYPITSINSMLKCGQDNLSIIKKCDCEKKILVLKYHCNLRTCHDCAKIRLTRIRKKLLPFLNSQKLDLKYQLYFLTISPKNYEDLEFGLKDIKKNFNKWKRHDYIVKRMEAGLYVVEIIQTWKGKQQYDKDGNFLYYHKKNGWNIHLHILLYGRRLDNKTRGRCFDCGQNQMSFDKNNQEFYCSNHKCQSRNVTVNQPKLNAMWKESTGSLAHFHITKINSVKSALNYVLKYVSVNKGDFLNEKYLAKYMKIIHKKRLISFFGRFTNLKISIPSIIHICDKCGIEIEYIFYRIQLWELEYKHMEKPPPDTNLFKNDEKMEIEVVRIE